MTKLGVGLAFLGGAALMYTFDPDRGRRRRARARDEAQHLMHVAPRSLHQASDDAAQRIRGFATQVRHWPSSGAGVDDEVLSERVRACLGRYCSHPGAVEVKANAGVVELRGPILMEEARSVVHHVQHVPGVSMVKDGLERHTSSDQMPSLSGGRRRTHPGLLRRGWPISLRWAVGAGGAGVVASGLARGGLRGRGLVTLGAGALVRAMTNRPLTALLGFGYAPEKAIVVGKTVTIDAPIEEVFGYFMAFENFPKFMRHVREVRRLDDNRWHWTVQGSSGLSFDWEGIVTQCEPCSRVAWTSTESATIRNRGEAHFEPLTDGSTRVTIRMSYEPPLGAVGHAVAKLLGADPKRELDDDMLRFKSLLETGKATGRGGPVMREDFGGN